MNRSQPDELERLLKALESNAFLCRWFGVGALVFLCVFAKPVLQNDPFYLLPIGAVAAAIYAYILSYKETLINRLTRHDDARILPWLISFVRSRSSDSMIPEAMFTTIGRLLMQFREEDIAIFTKQEVDFFNAKLEKDYTEMLTMDMRLIFSSQNRKRFFETQRFLRLGILNVIPLIGNERSLRILERCLKQAEKVGTHYPEPLNPNFVEAVRLALPPLQKRLLEETYQETLLRPASSTENSDELLRPLPNFTNDPPSQLLRAVDDRREP